MRYRDLPGWDRSLVAARLVWPGVPDADWQAIGDREPPEWCVHIQSANEIMTELWRMRAERGRR
jgi:hypothetical protein